MNLFWRNTFNKDVSYHPSVDVSSVQVTLHSSFLFSIDTDIWLRRLELALLPLNTRICYIMIMQLEAKT